MKKGIIVLCIMLCVLTVGCDISNNDSTQDNINESVKDDNMPEIQFFEKENLAVPGDDIEFPVDMSSIIKDNETFPINAKNEAIEVGKTLLKRNQDVGKMKNYNLVSITHATNDNIWKLNYSESQDMWSDLAVMCIVIEGDTGNIIAAWAEE